jgi:hypothetical protein
MGERVVCRDDSESIVRTQLSDGVARARRKPKTGLAEKLRDVETAVERLRVAEDELDRKRGLFRDALRGAHAVGASYALLGRVAGLSRQRVAQIIERD